MSLYTKIKSEKRKEKTSFFLFVVVVVVVFSLPPQYVCVLWPTDQHIPHFCHVTGHWYTTYNFNYAFIIDSSSVTALRRVNFIMH